MLWLITAVDPISWLIESDRPIGILAACGLIAVVALWRSYAKTLDLERKENEELRSEIKELNVEMRKYLLQQQSQQPRAERLISEAIDIVKDST
jgi:hypothetical protein